MPWLLVLVDSFAHYQTVLALSGLEKPTPTNSSMHSKENSNLQIQFKKVFIVNPHWDRLIMGISRSGAAPCGSRNIGSQ